MNRQHGVEEVIANVLAEFDRTLGLAGCAKPGDISRAALATNGATVPV